MTEYLTLTEVADRLGMNRRTPMRWAESGRLPATKTPGGHWRVSEDELERLPLRLSEFARLVGVTYQTALRWVGAGKLQDVQRTPGGHILVPASEVERIGPRRRQRQEAQS